MDTMRDVHVERGRTARLSRVEGDLKTSKDARIESTDGQTVAGKAHFKGNTLVNCNLECGSLKVEKGTLRVAGNLIVRGLVSVENALEVEGSAVADAMEAGGRITAGSVRCRDVKVGGRLTVQGEIACEEIRIGGREDIDGNYTGGTVEVGGEFRVSGSLALSGSLRIGGQVEVRETFTGIDMQVGGLYKGGKAILSAEAKMGHEVETREGFKAEVIKIGSRARCTGPLIGGVVELGKGCKVQDVYGRHVVAQREVRMASVFAEDVKLGDGYTAERITYTRSLEMAASAVCRNPPERVSSLPPFPL